MPLTPQTELIKSRDAAMRDTARHIARVGEHTAQAIANLALRAAEHDASKFSEAEWPTFAAITHDLKGLTYGSEEYKEQLRRHKPVIHRHQQANRHHPEFFGGDVSKMSLLDLIEMLCDWKAASERHDDGDIKRSIAINTKRFNLSPQLAAILRVTARELGWCDK